MTKSYLVKPHAPWFNASHLEKHRRVRCVEGTFRHTWLVIDRYIIKVARNNYREDLNRASSVDYREQIEAADHKTMFRITDSLIGDRTSTASVLPKTIDKATIPNMFTDLFVYEIQDVRRTLPQFTLNDDGCAVLTGFDSFRTLPFDEVENVINCLPNKSCDLDPIPATCLKQCVDQLVPVITEIITLSLNCGEFP